MGSTVYMTVCVRWGLCSQVCEPHVMVVGPGMGVDVFWFWPPYSSGPGMNVQLALGYW